MSFNMKMSDSLHNSVTNNITEWNSIELGKLLDYDFNKIGYRVDTTDIFSIAKEGEIKFFADLNNDGSVDEVQYILGTTNDADFTPNPNDKPLYRIINGDVTTHLVTNFQFAYTDSSGTEITPIGSLNSANQRKNIKGVSIDFNIGSPVPELDLYRETEIVNGNEVIVEEFVEVEWRKKFTPKNIY